jgi:pyruvate/2-oxoacid:ferredoxin oxidoreductase alpha subunit
VFWRRVVEDGEPVVIVERPKQEALDATVLAFGIADEGRPMVAALFDLYEREFAAMRHNANALVVPWDSLDDEGTAGEVWEHLLGGVPFDRAWWSHLRTKRITEK